MDTNIACFVILENPHGEILLLRRNKEPLGWGLPGGKLDISKETILQCAVREVYEETKIVLYPKDLVQIDNYTTELNFNAYIFSAKVKLSIPIINKEEHSAYIWLNKLIPEIKLAGNAAMSFRNYKWDYERMSLDYVLKFGKYKGLKIENIAAKDRNYLDWLLKEKVIDLQYEAMNIIQEYYRKIDLEHLQRQRIIEEEEYQENEERATQARYAKNLRDARTISGYKVIGHNGYTCEEIDDTGRPIRTLFVSEGGFGLQTWDPDPDGQ